MRSWGRKYVVLALVRVLVALTSRAVIHPDEYFQNPEVAANVVFDYSHSGGEPLTTWEWQARLPVRSIAPLWASSAAAFALVKASAVHADPSAEVLFLAQRGAMLVLSFVLDGCIYATSKSPLALFLFASSPVAFTFLIRPFSNSLETLLLAVSLYLTSRILSHRANLLVPLGAVLAFGVWTRITFVSFATPLVFAIIFHLVSRPRQGPVLLYLSKGGYPAVVSFALTAFILAVVDTRYFDLSRTLLEIALHPSRLLITPLNLLRYNISSDNLAQHGLHPRYLHALVNLPMLFGVGLLFVVSVMSAQVRAPQSAPSRDRKRAHWDRVLLASFLVPVALLSIQPHQEPRFLLPLIVPLVLLAPQVTRGQRKQSRKLRTFFWSLWMLHSMLFTVFFGYLHQGGLVPTLVHLNRELQAVESPTFKGIETVELVFWKTFMPPRHLVLPLTTGDDHTLQPSRNISFHDLGSTSFEELYSTLLSTVVSTAVSPSSRPRAQSKTLLITPSYLFNPLADLDPVLELSSSATAPVLCFDRVLDRSSARPWWINRGGIHIDMDRVGEMFEGYKASGWKGLGMTVWDVTRCES